MSEPRPQLLRLTRRRKTPKGLSQRAQIILLADQDWNNSKIAEHLNIDSFALQITLNHYQSIESAGKRKLQKLGFIKALTNLEEV
jgi:hypothetical protein